MTAKSDFLIVGAGIIGLTIAHELTRRYPNASITILEKEGNVGLHASGRNSGVLHSGVYYGSTTLKAQACAAGAIRMQEFANEHGIACNRSGKIIIASSPNDLPTLERLLRNARENGVRAQLINEAEIRDIEPFASPYQAGIYCPDTAVVDSKAVVIKLREMLEKVGVKFIFFAPLLTVVEHEQAVVTPQGRYSFGYLFNCAGAGADLVAKKFGMAQNYTLIPFKGIYYKLRSERAHLVRSNIYPAPDVNMPFLGVHLTRVISGDVYVGPTAIPAFGRENYGILQGMALGESLKIGRELFGMYKENKQNFRLLMRSELQKYIKPWFVASARKLMSSLLSSDLVPCNKVGIRPQLINLHTRTLEMDFILEKTPRTIHVLNSISPAFTSSMAFADMVIDCALAQ